MKKSILFVSTLVLILGVVSCSKDEVVKPSSNNTPQTVSQEESGQKGTVKFISEAEESGQKGTIKFVSAADESGQKGTVKFVSADQNDGCNKGTVKFVSNSGTSDVAPVEVFKLRPPVKK